MNRVLAILKNRMPLYWFSADLLCHHPRAFPVSVKTLAQILDIRKIKLCEFISGYFVSVFKLLDSMHKVFQYLKQTALYVFESGQARSWQLKLPKPNKNSFLWCHSNERLLKFDEHRGKKH